MPAEYLFPFKFRRAITIYPIVGFEKLEDLKHSPDLLNNVKIGLGCKVIGQLGLWCLYKTSVPFGLTFLSSIIISA